MSIATILSDILLTTTFWCCPCTVGLSIILVTLTVLPKSSRLVVRRRSSFMRNRRLNWVMKSHMVRFKLIFLNPKPLLKFSRPHQKTKQNRLSFPFRTGQNSMSVRLYKMSWIFELVITLLKPFFFLHFISFASFLFGFIPYLTSFFYFYLPSLCCAVCNVLSFDLFFLCHYYQMTMMMLICSISHSMLTCSFFKTMVNGYYGSSAFRIFFLSLTFLIVV